MKYIIKIDGTPEKFEKIDVFSYRPQCAPAFSNPDQKVHGFFDFYIVVMYTTIQNQLKKTSIIGLPKFTIVNWLKNPINMQILV